MSEDAFFDGVEKDIPIPARRKRVKIYYWEKMEIGESKFFPGKTLKSIVGTYAPLRAEGFYFVARTVTEDSVEGIRVWRVSQPSGVSHSARKKKKAA
ncbi:MAG: hypothetical protein KGI08_06995 [Thaumarchaeota archaeon]|nr:hypothetical protein [Nitrososphaerota archaeon]